MLEPEIAALYRRAGRLAAETLKFGAELIKEGVSLFAVAERIEKYIVEHGGSVAFPVNLAINDVAAHYTPNHLDKSVFKRGDVVKLDVGVHIDGYIGDTACTVEVGTNLWSRMKRAAEDALNVAIETMKPGVALKEVGGAIERVITSYGYKPIANLTGHSMAQYSLHAGASVPNIYDTDENNIIKVGDVYAVEPFATNGIGRVEGRKCGNIYRAVRERELKIEKGGLLSFFSGREESVTLFNRILAERKWLPFSERWVYSFDKKASSHIQHLLRYRVITPYPILREVNGGIVAQAEHTVLMTENGAEIVTKI